MPRLVVFPLLISILSWIPSCYAIDFQNAIYENVVIGLSSSLPDDSLENITVNIQRLFTEGSSVLCKATDGRAVFGGVTIVVPSDWNISSSLNLEKVKPKGENFQNADIQVDEVFDFVVRRVGSCGQRGENIQVPASEILNPGNSTAKSLISAWSQFRYGVYPENSPGNYYDSETKQFLPNSCTDVPLNFTYENSICHNESSADCEININLEENDGITSSLLYRTDLANVEYFCNESTHNKLAQTLQNRMCDRRSVKEIINQNEDFASGFRHHDCNNVSPVKISYVQYNCQRIFIGLALKEEHNFDDIINSFQSSLLLTLSTTASEGSTVTLLNGDEILFNETVGEDRSDLIKSISDKFGKDKLKPSSNIRNLLNTIRREVNDSTETCDYSFLLITNSPNVPVRTTEPPPTTTQITTTDSFDDVDYGSGSEPRLKRSFLEEESFWEYADEGDVANDEISSEFLQVRRKRSASSTSTSVRKEVDDELIDAFKELGIRVYGVSVGNSTDYTLDVLTSATGGKTYAVESLDVGETTGFLAPMIALSDNEKKKNSLTLQQNLGADKTKYELSFKTDNPDVALLIRHTNVNELKNISLSKGTTVVQADCVPISSMNATSCTVNTASTNNVHSLSVEEWTAEIETVISSPVSVTIVSRSKRQAANIELTPGDNRTGPDIDFREKSLFLYVCVEFGRAAVRNAEVELIISSGGATNFTIFDDGKGSDVVNGDGCYSTVWDRCVRPGRYNIDFVVTTTPESCAVNGRFPNGTFICDHVGSGAKRIKTAGSILVKACRKYLTGDFVKDLKVDFKYGTSEAFITWTDTWDMDTVAVLTLRYLPYHTPSRNVTEWANSTLLQIVRIRQKNGKRTYPLDLTGVSEKYFSIALRAEDEAGKSEISLPMNVTIPIWSSTSSTDTVTDIKSTQAIPNGTVTNIKQAVPNSTHIKHYPGIIISLVFLIVFVLGGAVVLFMLYKWRTNRNDIAASELLR